MINGLCNIVDDDVSKKAEKYVFTKAEEQSFNLFFLAMAKHTEFLWNVPGLAERMSVTHASSIFCKDNIQTYKGP